MLANFLRAAAKLPTVTVDSTNTKTVDLTTSYSFNYGSSYAIGKFIVVVLTGRSGGTLNWTGLTDSAGNTYTEYVQGTQPNGLTVTSIYYSTLTSAVTSATTFTATLTGTPAHAQHATVFALTGVSAPSASATAQIDNAEVVSTVAVSTVASGAGVAINGLSSGQGGNNTVTSISAGFTTGSSLRVAFCSQYTAYSVYKIPSGTSITNTFTISSTGNMADVIALFV